MATSPKVTRKPLIKTARSHADGDITHHHVRVHDPYGGVRYRLGRTSIGSFMNVLDWYLRRFPNMGFDHPLNIVKKAIYLPSGMKAWSAYIPGGFATYYASEPHHKIMDNGTKMDIVTRLFFRHTYDAAGLRSRATLLAALALDYITAEHRDTIQWVSIAAGAGQHVHAALQLLPQSVRSTVEWTLVDIDPDIRNFAEALYEKNELEIAKTEFVTGDIHDMALQQSLATLKPNIIDVIGLCDYLEDDVFIGLFRTLYEQLASGSMLVCSNMNSARPHLAVHQRGVGWPGVIPRSTGEVVGLLRASGIPASAIMTYCPQDKVYIVYRIEKP